MKYVSELKELNGKLFSSIDELTKAEAEIQEKNKAKAAASKERKEDASVVEAAIKKADEATTKYQKELHELNEKLGNDLEKIHEDYHKKVEAIYKEVAEARKERDKALDEFLEKHPEGYHQTITGKDGSTIKVDVGGNTDITWGPGLLQHAVPCIRRSDRTYNIDPEERLRKLNEIDLAGNDSCLMSTCVNDSLHNIVTDAIDTAFKFFE